MNLSRKWTTILVAGMIYINCSMMLIEMFSATIRFVIAMIYVILIWVLAGKRGTIKTICISKSIPVLAALLVLLISFSCTLNGWNLTFDLYTVLMIIFGALLAATIDIDNFYCSYIDAMTFFGLTGSLLFVLYRIFPGLFIMFPTQVWHGSIGMKNLVLCVVQTDSQYIRNFGIFYEPGLFSLYIVFALYFALYRYVFNSKRIIILIIALITTMSTSGYICGAIVIIMFLLIRKNISKKLKKYVLLGTGIATIIILVYLFKNPSYTYFLIGKFSEISTNNTLSMTRVGSGYERWRSFVLAIDAIKDNPLTGIAYNGWLQKFNGVIGTITPLNWFGLYGFIYGMVMNYCFAKSAIIKKQGKTDYASSIVGISVFFLNVLSQNVTNSIIVLIFIFQSIKRNKMNEEGRGYEKNQG